MKSVPFTKYASEKHNSFSIMSSLYILLTGADEITWKRGLIGVGPSAKHEDRSQILQTEFPDNFVWVRSVRFFLYAIAEMGRKPGQETFVSCPGLSNNVGDTGQKFKYKFLLPARAVLKAYLHEIG